MEWGFNYEGSVEPKQDLRCPTCLAKVNKECPTHAANTTKGCAHCAAAAGGDCHKHHGLAASVSHAKDSGAIPADAQEDFAQAAEHAIAEAKLLAAPKEVTCTMRGSRTAVERSLVIEIKASR